jgi:hypothetical protein
VSTKLRYVKALLLKNNGVNADGEYSYYYIYLFYYVERRSCATRQTVEAIDDDY